MTNQEHASALERLQKTGLSMEELRQVVAGQSRPEFIHRVREAGISMSELKEIIHVSSDTNTGSATIGTSAHSVGNTPPAGGVGPQD